MIDNLIKAKIKAIYLHPVQKVPIVFISDESEEVIIPMVVGFLEAQSILTAWQGVDLPRPMTIDLAKSLIEDDFGATVKQVVIHDLQDGAYLASVIIEHNGTTIERDTRPSDALALAIRTKSPIYITKQLIDKTISEHENTRAMLEYLEAESQDSDEIVKF